MMFPSADLYALTADPVVELDLDGRTIRTTFLDKPFWRRHRALSLPFMPIAWWFVGRRRYDLVITSHHAFAHSNRLVKEDGRHLAYVHSPARYVWSPEIDERGSGLASMPIRGIFKFLDRRFSKGVDSYAANSSAVAERISRFWKRQAEVIHPPVRVEYFGLADQSMPTRDFVLGFGRWIPYKNLHRVIEAADLAGMPVKIAGRGSDVSRIVAAAAVARVPVEIINSPDDLELRELYRNAACLVFPTDEDFGIVPVEAQAAGTPVVAPGVGGALDTVKDGVSGVLTDGCEARQLAAGIAEAVKLEAGTVRASVSDFSSDSFNAKVKVWVRESLRQEKVTR